MDFDYVPSVTYSEDICDKHTTRGRDDRNYIRGRSKIVDVMQRGSTVSALLISQDLAENIRKALCISHDYRAYEKVKNELGDRFESKKIGLRTWAEAIEHDIALKRKRIKRRGEATEGMQADLMDLIQERVRNRRLQDEAERDFQNVNKGVKMCQKRLTKAWLEVDRLLDVAWVDAGIIKDDGRRRLPGRQSDDGSQHTSRSSSPARSEQSHWSPSRGRRNSVSPPGRRFRPTSQQGRERSPPPAQSHYDRRQSAEHRSRSRYYSHGPATHERARREATHRPRSRSPRGPLRREAERLTGSDVSPTVHGHTGRQPLMERGQDHRDLRARLAYEPSSGSSIVDTCYPGLSPSPNDRAEGMTNSTRNGKRKSPPTCVEPTTTPKRPRLGSGDEQFQGRGVADNKNIRAIREGSMLLSSLGAVRKQQTNPLLPPIAKPSADMGRPVSYRGKPSIKDIFLRSAE